MVPWVSDLTVRNGGWRDLSQTKYRLRHGDAMLDLTYRNSVPRHHIAESMSELTYYMYVRLIPASFRHVTSNLNLKYNILTELGEICDEGLERKPYD